MTRSFYDAADTMFQEFIDLSRFKRTVQGIRKLRAKFRLALAHSERHLSAKLPAVVISAQLIEAAMFSGASTKVVLTAVRTGLGGVDDVIHSTRRIFRAPAAAKSNLVPFRSARRRAPFLLTLARVPLAKQTLAPKKPDRYTKK